jgi:AcrR family transcriptional regulator
MGKRAEQVEATRQRIVDATVDLHSTVGPASTTISAIAEKAGVTRLTVYRHFPDLESLFEACGQRWTERHPAPDPASWPEIRDLEARARHALGELYGWYRDSGHELRPILRDLETLPPAAQQETHKEFQAYADALVIGSGVRGHARRRLRATAGLVVSFFTWHSLAVEQGLDDREAVELAVRLLTCAMSTPRRS